MSRFDSCPDGRHGEGATYSTRLEGIRPSRLVSIRGVSGRWYPSIGMLALAVVACGGDGENGRSGFGR